MANPRFHVGGVPAAACLKKRFAKILANFLEKIVKSYTDHIFTKFYNLAK